MRKVFKLQDLECANCAAKMEEAIKKLPGVKRGRYQEDRRRKHGIDELHDPEVGD